MEIPTIPQLAFPLTETRVPASLSSQRQPADAAGAKRVAQEFEAMFLGMMLKSMRETVGKDNLTGGGRAEETYRSLLDQEYAAAAAKNGGIGLAQMIEKELTRGMVAPAAAKGVKDAD
jgi:peptidoglycan hydrolase FlgJ